jgi:CelD/BcsL family acetyltransferase involved in cellulose biosynthesis
VTSTETKPAACQAGSASLRPEWLAANAEFERLKPEWAELFRLSGRENAFLSFEWMFTWWRHWGEGRRLALVAVRDAQERLAALAPFCISRQFGHRRLAFLGDAHVGSDYLGILARPGCERAAAETIAEAVWRHRREWDYIELRDAREGPELDALCAALEGRGMRQERTAAAVCHHIPLPASFDEYLAHISINLRSNFRRRWRAIQRTGPAEFAAYSGATIEEHFPELIRLHGMRFEQRRQQSAFLEPGVPEFHAEALKALVGRGWARLFLLRAGGTTVAALYGFSVGSTFQFYQCGMHPGWMHMGVGQLMVGSSIQEAIRTGHTDFDFLRGDEPYKAQWAEQSRHTVRARLFDGRPRSLAARAAFKLSAALRHAKHTIASARLRRGADGK